MPSFSTEPSEQAAETEAQADAIEQAAESVQESMSDRFSPITPSTATPQKIMEAVYQYCAYLDERRDTPVSPETHDRQHKVERSIQWLEQSIAYWLSFNTGSHDPLINDALVHLNMAAETHRLHYTIPNLWAAARKIAQNARRASKTVRPPQSTSTPPTSLLPPMSERPEAPTPPPSRPLTDSERYIRQITMFGSEEDQ